MEMERHLVNFLMGTDTIKETTAPDGYNLDGAKEKTFTLSETDDSVKIVYDNAGNGKYTIKETDTPVMGSISLKKTGEFLTGHEDDQGFVYENDNMTGAVYGLFAKEDIVKDDGTVCMESRNNELIQKQHQKLERSNSQELVKMEKKQQISTKDIIM